LTIGKPDDETVEGNALRYEKPVNEEAQIAARAAQDYRAQVLLGFARFPVVLVEGDCVSQTIVEFADLRYTEPGRGGRSGFAAVGIPVTCPPESGAANSR
jgi:hypothetical protein